MGIRFSADEVFRMAERTEANGAAFYRRAAELRPADESAVADTFRRLAEMEDVVGLLSSQQAEFVRKCVRDLHELAAETADSGGVKVGDLSEGDIENAMSALLGDTG